MSLTLKDIIDGAQAIATILTPITILLTMRQLRLGRSQMKQQLDSTALNFVLGAEGQLDSIHDEILSASPHVIRSAFAPEIDPGWTEEELRTFVYLRRLYDHVSRMIYIVRDNTIDFGMDEEDRQTFCEIWERALRKYDYHPVMRRIHHNAIRFKDYNTFMLALSRRILATEMPSPSHTPSPD